MPPEYVKYQKMLKMHVPRIAVELKMKAEGLDPAVLDGVAPAATPESAPTAPAELPPEYAKCGGPESESRIRLSISRRGRGRDASFFDRNTTRFRISSTPPRPRRVFRSLDADPFLLSPQTRRC